MSNTPTQRKPRKVKPTLANYEVSVTAFARVLVIDAKDRSHAYTLAQEALSCGDFEIDEMEIRDDNCDPVKTESLRRSANAVSDPED